MTRYSKPCPDLPKGVRCPLCGSAYICGQPERSKRERALRDSAETEGLRPEGIARGPVRDAPKDPGGAPKEDEGSR